MVHLPTLIHHLRFVQKKPFVLPRIMKGFFNALVLRKSVLRTIDLAVTYDCHYRCPYCSAKFLHQSHQQPMSIEQMAKLLNDASQLGRIHTNFTGGEPLMRGVDDLCKLLKMTKPESHLYSLVTNSLNVSEDKLTRLKESGLDTIQLSLESLDPDENDQMRGVPGSFKKAMDALKWSKALGLNICLSTVVTHENIHHLKGMIEFSRDQKCSLLLNKASSSGKWVHEKEMKMAGDDLDLFEKLLKIPHTRSDIVLNFRGFQGCPGGIERLYITAYGDVLMCPHVQISYGNVLEEPLASIYDRMVQMDHLRSRSTVCKHAFDRGFYTNYLLPIENIERMPIHYKDHPKWQENKS
jgi:MoaA/NifB/PqqE/SkfB family radical SAM enzyme